MKEFEAVVSFFPHDLKEILLLSSEELKNVATEIRIAKNAPLSISTPNGRVFLNKKGERCSYFEAHQILENSLTELIERITNYSFFAFQKDIERGVITLKGGHRVGICGKTSTQSPPKITEISSLNFRIAKQIDGASKEIFPIIKNQNTIILSPPNGGKTTILRDIAKTLSLSGKTISVIDSKSEISIGQGFFYSADLLEGFSIKEGISHALRYLSPEIILCDEITSLEEVKSIEEGMNSGVKFIVTAHAQNAKEAQIRPVTKALFSLFSLAVFLKNLGEIKEVLLLA